MFACYIPSACKYIVKLMCKMKHLLNNNILKKKDQVLFFNSLLFFNIMLDRKIDNYKTIFLS